MNLTDINRHLSEGTVESAHLFPRLDALQSLQVVFKPSFGLDRLPEDAGLLIVRGARQYGKSTWLEGQIKATIQTFGPGSAFYLNGDDVKNQDELLHQMENLIPLYRAESAVKRLFIDEITAVPHWEQAIKRAADRGILRDILVISTGSKATDLRRGVERLPGRKGRLVRSHYIFTPLSYQEFDRVCRKRFHEKTVIAYLLTGGCPIACHDMATQGRLSELPTQMIRDWIYGECFASGRDRTSLLAVMEILIRQGGQPIGQTVLAREAGLANNTVAAGYIGLLSDLMVVIPAWNWDASRKVIIRRKPAKFHFVNLLSAVAWHPAKLRSVDDFEALPRTEQAKFWEWLVAQELWRRQAIESDEFPDVLRFWSAGDHEIDFVEPPDRLLEVKLGPAGPFDFMWFPKVFPKKRLTIVNEKPFETSALIGQTMEAFLLDTAV